MRGGRAFLRRGGGGFLGCFGALVGRFGALLVWFLSRLGRGQRQIGSFAKNVRTLADPTSAGVALHYTACERD